MAQIELREILKSKSMVKLFREINEAFQKDNKSFQEFVKNFPLYNFTINLRSAFIHFLKFLKQSINYKFLIFCRIIQRGITTKLIEWRDLQIDKFPYLSFLNNEEIDPITLNRKVTDITIECKMRKNEKSQFTMPYSIHLEYDDLQLRDILQGIHFINESKQHKSSKGRKSKVEKYISLFGDLASYKINPFVSQLILDSYIKYKVRTSKTTKWRLKTKLREQGKIHLLKYIENFSKNYYFTGNNPQYFLQLAKLLFYKQYYTYLKAKN